MKKLKKLIIPSLIPFCLAFGLIVAADLYTQRTMDVLAEKVAQQAVWGSGWNAWKIEDTGPQPETLHLGELLYANIHANKPEDVDWWGAGGYTDDAYKNGWRKLIANNPQLAYAALNQYGSSFFTALNENLEEKRQGIIAKKPEKADILNQYSKKQFWNGQRKLFDRYVKLTDALLKLSDTKLNQFIEDSSNQLWAGKEASELQNWLLDNGHITRLPQEWSWGDDPKDGGWSFTWYPMDLLFLTHRTCRDFEEWTPRKFLTEAKKFALEAKKKLPS